MHDAGDASQKQLLHQGLQLLTNQPGSFINFTLMKAGVPFELQSRISTPHASMLATADGFTDSLISISFLNLKLSVRNMQQEERGWCNSDTSEKSKQVNFIYTANITTHTSASGDVQPVQGGVGSNNTHQQLPDWKHPGNVDFERESFKYKYVEKNGSLCENKQLREIKTQISPFSLFLTMEGSRVC